jgi:thiol-disulfide isomerase/thioredoxin
MKRSARAENGRYFGSNRSGRRIQPPIGRYPGRPIPVLVDPGASHEMFDDQWFAAIMVIRRRRGWPAPSVGLFQAYGARDRPFWSIQFIPNEGAMLISRSICSLIVVTSIFLSSVAAQPKRSPTPYGVLYNEWKAEVTALDDITPALTASDKRYKKREVNAKFTRRFLELAKAHLDDDLWIDCLIWTSVKGVPGTAFDEMFDVLRDNANAAKNDVQLQLLMSEFIKLQSDRIDPALSAIAETHPKSGVRGAALFALAARTKRGAEENGDVQLAASAEKLMERVITEYPKVSTYRGVNLENATALLEELRSPVALSKSAPSTKGTLITGDPFDLRETIRGKVAIISFSGHWCGPCVAMHPILKEIVSTFPEDAVVIVEINSDQLTQLSKVREKIESDGLKWTVVSDGGDGPISKQWHIEAWPTFFVIDADGLIRRRVTGNVGRRLIAWVQELASKSE